MDDIARKDLLVGLRLKMLDDHSHYVARRPDEDLSWRDPHTPWHELDAELRPAELKARKSLKARIAAELK